MYGSIDGKQECFGEVEERQNRSEDFKSDEKKHLQEEHKHLEWEERAGKEARKEISTFKPIQEKLSGSILKPWLGSVKREESDEENLQDKLAVVDEELEDKDD